MPIYYGFDYSYLIYVLPALLFAMWAQANVKSTFSKYSKIPSAKGMTGYDAARLILDANGLSHVRVEAVAGDLTDHYDPGANVIRLSETVFGVSTAAAVGVAAHEAGHAVQYAVGYYPIRLRTAIIPVTKLGSTLAFPLVLLGLLFSFPSLAMIGVILFGAAVLFQQGTLIIGGQLASILSTAEPIVSMIVGVLVFREALTAQTAIGAVLVVAASILIVALDIRKADKQTASDPS